MANITFHEHAVSPLPNSQQTEGTTATTVKQDICYTSTPLYRRLKFLFLSYKIGGLAFKKDFRVTGLKRHLYGSHVYSFLILLFLIFNVFRLFTVYHANEVLGISLLFKIAQCTWGLEVLGHYIACLATWESYNRLPGFFVDWNKMQQNTSKTLNSMKRVTRVCVVVLWIYVCADLVCCVYLLFWTDNFVLTPWDKTTENVVFIQMMSSICHFYFTLAWLGPSMLMFIICRIIASMFREVTNEITILSEEEFVNVVDKFEGLRRRHQKVCKLVTRADDIFSMHIAMSLSGSVIIACLVMYIIAYDDTPQASQLLVIIVKLFWLSSVLGKIIIDCVSGAIINDAVSSHVAMPIGLVFDNDYYSETCLQRP